MRRIKPGEHVRVTVTLDGKRASGFAQSRTLLSDFLRRALGAFGVREGCSHGVCGACTVEIDGRLARACMRLAVGAEGADIRTVEGLAEAGGLSPLQQAFSRHGALQCGFCTAGVLVSATRFLRDHSNPTEAQTRRMLSGHICRCTGYEGMVRAILEIAASGAADESTDKEKTT